MKIRDCKILETKLGHADVKVKVTMEEYPMWSFFKLRTEVIGGYASNRCNMEIKGDYVLIKLAYDKFDATEAHKFLNP